MKSFLFFFLAPFVFLAGCSKGERTTVETSLHMGTFVSISLPGKSPDEASRFAVEADRIMEEMEGSLSVFRKNSDVSILN